MITPRSFTSICIATILLFTAVTASAQSTPKLTCDESPFFGLFGTCRELLTNTVTLIHQQEQEIERLKDRAQKVCAAAKGKRSKKASCKKALAAARSSQAMLDGLFIGGVLQNQLQICDCPEVSDQL